MPRIVKQTGFFKKNHHYIIGGFWFLAGIISLLLREGFIYYMYMPLGLGMMIYRYSIRNKTEESISWNKKVLFINDLANGKLSYPWEDIDTLFISNNHLTIKYGPAGGIILDLQGYSQGDIDKLNAAITSDFQLSEVRHQRI